MNEIREKVLEVLALVDEKMKTCKCTGSQKKGMVELSTLKPGDRFDTEIGKMIVLNHDEAAGTTKVIQDDFYAEDVQFDRESPDYTKSALKKMFDAEIAPKYLAVFGDALVEHEVHLLSVDMQDYGAFKCKVRPLAFDEAREYNSLIVKPTLSDWWWTCTPWSTSDRGWKYSVAVVSPSGHFNNDGCYNFYGVRPFCILKSNIFVSKGE